MDVSEFLSFGDVVNVRLSEEAFPFERDPADDFRNRAGNSLQGRVIFADGVGLHLESHGGRCMPLFEEDSSKIENSEVSAGTFFPWQSVVSLKRIADSKQYEIAWQKHERDEQAFYNAKGSWPETSHEFYSWRRSLSPEDYDAAYNAPPAN